MRHQRSGRFGTVHTYIDVPDFDKDPLSLSGIVMNDPRAPAATPLEALGGLTTHTPTTRRDFTSPDDVTALVRVYQKHVNEPVAMVFHIVDGNGRTQIIEQATLPADRFRENGSTNVTVALPVATLDPGAYALRVEATSRGSSVRRDVPFRTR